MEGTRRVGENRGRGSNKIGLDGWVRIQGLGRRGWGVGVSTILYIHAWRAGVSDYGHVIAINYIL